MSFDGPTYYSLLDVETDIADDELKRVIRKVLRETHPDMNDGRRSQRYVDAQKASEVLLDPVLRRDYDRSIGIVRPGGDDFAQENSSADEAGGGGADWEFGDGTLHETGGGGSPRCWRFQPRKVPGDVPIRPVYRLFGTPGGMATAVPPAGDDSQDAPIASESRIAPYMVLLAAVVGVFLIIWVFIPRTGIMPPDGGLNSVLFHTGRIVRVIALVVMVLAGFALYGGASVLSSLLVIFVIGTPITWTSEGDLEFFGMVVLSSALLAAGIGMVRARGRQPQTDSRPTVPYEIVAEYDTYGEPGYGLARSGFGQSEVRAGMIGEWATANSLESLYYFPGAKVFHSLRFTARSEADVDHAVLYGNKLALIDSKLWPSSGYVFADDGSGALEEYAPGCTEPRIRELRMTEALAAYRKYFPDCDVRAWVLIHPATDAPYFDFSNEDAPDGLLLGGADDVVNGIGFWFGEDAEVPPVDRVRVRALLSLVKC